MKILIFHAKAGYGHQKVAEVVGRGFLARGFQTEEVRVVDALDFASPVFRTVYPRFYFYSVKYLPDLWGWFYDASDCGAVYPWVRPLRTFGNRMESGKLLSYAAQESPDFILCTHFFSAEVFARAKREGRIRARLGVIVTDFFPHRFWINPGTDFYWVMSGEGKRTLIERGVAESTIVAGGIPVDPHFKPSGQRLEILKKWGFDEKRFTLLLTSGSFGLGPQAAILSALEKFSEKIQCFVVCGNNRFLKEALDKNQYSFPVKVFGFVDFMHELMEASDLMIAKSGGSTTSEALAKGAPMVVLHPIPGQETHNARLLKERNAAFFLEEPGQIQLILKAIFENPPMLEAKREAIWRLGKPNATEDLIDFVSKYPKS